MSIPEAVACPGFLLIPVPAYLLARMGSNMIHPRYLLPIIIGFSVLFALGLWKASGRHSVAAAVYVVLLA